ncbi:MAG: hypothetical protein AAF402_15085 [Pseudomonadota bacterium]
MDLVSTTLESANVMVGTPAYNGMVHSDYVHSLLSYGNAGIKFGLHTIGNESLITRARNTVLANFNHFTAFTHLLFLDADVYLDAKDLITLIDHKVDVVGAPVSLKSSSNFVNTDVSMSGTTGLKIAGRVGTAAVLMSRKACSALIDAAVQDGRVYSVHKQLQQPGLPDEHYDVFRTGIQNGEYLSEDFFVCSELKQLGFDIHVDTSIRTRHHGVVAFDS